MKLTKQRNVWLVARMCVATIMPRTGSAAETPASHALAAHLRTTDVRLNELGQFQGQIVNAEGRPAASAEVELWKNGQPLARSVADQHGRFEFHGLKAGVYQVLAPGTGSVLRLWQPAAAPPSAQSAVLLVQGPVLRGQHPHELGCPPPGAYDGAIMRTLSNPWVFSGLLAAGIAIPIALSDDDDGDGS